MKATATACAWWLEGCARDGDPEKVLGELQRRTALPEQCRRDLLALVDGQPRQLSLPPSCSSTF